MNTRPTAGWLCASGAAGHSIGLALDLRDLQESHGKPMFVEADNGFTEIFGENPQGNPIFMRGNHGSSWFFAWFP